MKVFAAFLALFGVASAASAETFTTSNCSSYGHPEFQIQVSDSSIPKEDVTWFLSVLESMVASGGKFKAGETIQVGWMLTQLEDGDQGTLRVTEPDMKSFPVKFVNSTDATIKHLRSQKDTVESFVPASAIQFPSLTQSIIVHRNYQHCQRLMLDRANPEDMDSGWWLSDMDDPDGNQDPNQFQKISLYQFALDRLELVKFLALPATTQVLLDGHSIRVAVNQEELFPKEGSFIDMLNKRK